MGFFKDILSIFKKYNINYIDRKQENQETFTFKFDATKVKEWKPGQHGIFFVNHKKIHKSIRPFSIASIKQEDTIMISTKISNEPSEFKKALLSLESSDSLTMRGPVGPLYIRENKPTLLIAGGIGITPHRAILKDLNRRKQFNQPIVLLYIDSQNNHIYKDELKDFSKNISIDIKYLDNRETLINEINQFILMHNNNGRYFISGTKAMAKAMKKYLKSHKVKGKYIYKDIFYGY